MSEIDSKNDSKESVFDKAKKLPLLARIVLSLAFSSIWILIASNFNIGIQINWLLSTLVIAWIISVFFPFRKDKEEEV